MRLRVGAYAARSKAAFGSKEGLGPAGRAAGTGLGSQVLLALRSCCRANERVRLSHEVLRTGVYAGPGLLRYLPCPRARHALHGSRAWQNDFAGSARRTLAQS